MNLFLWIQHLPVIIQFSTIHEQALMLNRWISVGNFLIVLEISLQHLSIAASPYSKLGSMEPTIF